MQPGIDLVQNFISEKEELALISKITPNRVRIINKNNRRSSIQRYGTKIYSNNNTIETLPSWGVELGDKLKELSYLENSPKHITVNTYKPGDSILPHIDKEESGPIITVLSLLSDAEMVLSKDDKKITILLPKRSLLQLTGEFRYNWYHEILPVKSLRYSIVFRD